MMINEYFTLLASLEYNMQEMYRVQKLANDLVDITVTVTTDSLVYFKVARKTVSSTLQDIHFEGSHFNHSRLVDAQPMVSKICPIIAEHLAVTCVPQ